MLLIFNTYAHSKQNEKIDVVFLNPGFTHGFWGAVTSTMKASAEDLNINLEVLSADRDRIKMVNFAQAIAKREVRPDYVVLVNELQQGVGMADIFDEVNIPYFFLLNRIAVDEVAKLRAQGQLKHYVGSITPKNFETGYMTTKALINSAREVTTNDKSLKLLALLGDTATPAAVEREAGMRLAIAEAGDVEIVRAISVDWLFDRAKSLVESFLKNHSADIIWTASGPIAFGAMEAVTEAGLQPGKDVQFAGVGWFPDALDAVAANRMTMTYGGYFITGAWSMVVLRDLHNGIELENGGELNSPLTGVDSSNIDDFKRLIYDIEWPDVDFTQFLRGHTQQANYDFSVKALFHEIESQGIASSQ